ncbi:MAG TPA: M28 family peptidase [Candidatus Aminicenantes bacterium]|nr:M28 family peptidase [Candidatus Aminicenantes bacterium]HRY64246.1 M28 family peptidase [Candidatus Aminicenantes bacterium]HRZ71159.1 M28 family peptidase [Candidatus Aminicenantes bacterium]
MSKRPLSVFACAVAGVLALAAAASAQYTPWLYWTFLPQSQMDEIVGETSGESAWNTIAEINAFNRQRFPEEFAGNFLETQVVVRKLKSYGFENVEIVTYPGGPAWVALKGDLWETKPGRQKLASINDMLPMLASGSADADVTADLVWVGRGTPKEIADAGVAGKIAVTEGALMMTYGSAVGKGALGVISISLSRPYFDPLQMPWTGIMTRRRPGGPGRQPGQPGQPGQEPPPAGQAAGQPPAQPGAPPDQAAAPAPAQGFAFQLNAREGDILKRRLMAREKITVRAQVLTKTETADLENVVCAIPGADPAAGEIIFSAHLFEGTQKQGANDNISGSAAILEVARTLQTLIADGRLPRPKRTIRFIWGPEFSGIGEWVRGHREIMDRTLCNINMDMVGEWLSKNLSSFCLMRTTYGNPHYINDVMENYYRYVGEGSRERIQNRGGASGVAVRIVAPTGADEPFAYSIETHYGASDHEVFNDWAVGVPGIMMIAWPDQWYHTSGDTADKSDPTQLKRVAVIGAAGAYTVAAADAAAASAIAGEIASNATRRLGHGLAAALEAVKAAKAETFADDSRYAQGLLEAAVLNEKETLATVLELAPGDAALAADVARLTKSVEAVGAANLAALEVRRGAAGRRLGVKAGSVVPTELEKRAARIVPRPTAKVRQTGYREYQKSLMAVPGAERLKFPVAGKGLSLANTGEMQLLINGKHSALDIRKMLDAQNERRSTLQAVLNYLEILKLAGLVEW